MDKEKELDSYIETIRKQIASLDLKLIAVFVLSGVGFVLNLFAMRDYKELALETSYASIKIVVVTFSNVVFFLSAIVNFFVLISGMVPRKKDKSRRKCLNYYMDVASLYQSDIYFELQKLTPETIYNQKVHTLYGLSKLAMHKHLCLNGAFVTLFLMIMSNMVMFVFCYRVLGE